MAAAPLSTFPALSISSAPLKNSAATFSASAGVQRLDEILCNLTNRLLVRAGRAGRDRRRGFLAARETCP